MRCSGLLFLSPRLFYSFGMARDCSVGVCSKENRKQIAFTKIKSNQVIKNRKEIFRVNLQGRKEEGKNEKKIIITKKK